MNTKIIVITFCLIISCEILQAYQVEEAQTQGSKRKPTQTSGKVYLLSEHNQYGSKTGYYKIGKTIQDVKKRISDLQGGNPRKIEEVESHQVSDMSEAETRAHQAVKKWNTKATYGGGSEWFHVPQNEYDDFYNKFNDAVKNKKTKPSTSFVSLLKALMSII